jgi:hypothetical protein
MYETSFKLTDHITRESEQSVKMKTFTDQDPAIVERKVNDWMNAHNVKIRHVGQSQSEKSGRFVFIISVFYSS